MIKNAILVETYSRDRWSIYGLWSVELDLDIVQIAAVVGVPPYQVSTAEAAGTGRGMATAWFENSGDWEGLTEDRREEALSMLIGEAAAIVGDMDIG